MGNKLKKLLDQKDNGLALNIRFKNPDDRAEFVEALERIGETGQPQKVPVPQFLEIKKKNGDYQYPLKKVDDIVDMDVIPSPDIISFPILVDGIQEKYELIRTRTSDGVYLNSANSSVINVRLELIVSEKNVNFTYSSHPSKAKSMEELVMEYKRFLALIDKLFNKNVLDEKIEDVKNFFSYSLNKYQHAMELCDVLGINLTPEMMLSETDEECLIEKMNLLLVKRSVIRQNDKLNHIEMANVDSIEKGQQLFATYLQKAFLDIFGHHKELYTVNCIFGAEILNIERDSNGHNVVYFKDSESKPMYRAYSVFLSLKDAEEEMKSIINKRENYENALSWSEQLKKLLEPSS